MLAGPSEVVILADESANPEWVAADALARCEHDPHSWTVLVTTSRRLGESVMSAVETQAPLLSTGEFAFQSWRNNGRVLLAESLVEAVAITNDIAPEHLQVMTSDSPAISSQLVNFGSLFIGGERTGRFRRLCLGTESYFAYRQVRPLFERRLRRDFPESLFLPGAHCGRSRLPCGTMRRLRRNGRPFRTASVQRRCVHGDGRSLLQTSFAA